MYKINLGCGNIFIDTPDWLNLDFSPANSSVRRANLLNRLPLSNESVEVVYSSHFLEHVPRGMVQELFREFLRVLKPGGALRLVVPDLENIAREYLTMRTKGMHDKADFSVLELVDQCVRHEPGGELGRFYNKLISQNNDSFTPIKNYIQERTGEHFGTSVTSTNDRAPISLLSVFGELRKRFEQCWIRLCLSALPAAFRAQNVSLAAVGERHQWLWDFHQLKIALEAEGFTKISRESASTSQIKDFPFYPLDLDSEGRPRKGTESLFLEAFKTDGHHENTSKN